MKPLVITAALGGPVALQPGHPIAIDALLAYAVCQRDGIAPAVLPSQIVPIEIPVQRSACSRFHLASFGMFEIEHAEKRYINKRAPIEQYQTIGSHKIKRAQITAGPNKSYRIPMETLRLVDDSMTWWCIGDAEHIEALLALIGYLGKKRSVGLGRVERWDVQTCETWPGFPVVLDGRPLRNLPPDHDGLRDAPVAYGNLSYPYWNHATEEVCACPL